MSKTSPSFTPSVRKPRFIEHPRPLTHFICIPIDNKSVIDKLIAFQYEAEKIDQPKTIHDDWYALAPTLNFNLWMLPLGTKDLIYKATKVLEDMKDEINEYLSENELIIDVKGIDQFTLGPKSKSSRVLFAWVGWNDTLINLSDMIIKRLLDNEILFDNELAFINYDRKYNKFMVKFHWVLINSTYNQVDPRPVGFNGNYKLYYLFRNKNCEQVKTRIFWFIQTI